MKIPKTNSLIFYNIQSVIMVGITVIHISLRIKELRNLHSVKDS